jgi:hypothetical protein
MPGRLSGDLSARAEFQEDCLFSRGLGGVMNQVEAAPGVRP